MRRVLRALGLAAAWVAGAAVAQPSSQSLDECVAAIERQLFEQQADESPRARETCPALVDALGAPWMEALHGSSADTLSAQALVSLAELALAYEAASSTSSASSIDVASLDGVLEAIREPDLPVEMSLWQRFMRWLRGVLGLDRRGEGSWLAEWLQSIAIPPQIALVILIAIGALLVVVTISVVINELVEAGVLRRRTTSAALQAAAGGPDDDEPSVRSIDDVRRAPLARQPGLLLVLVVNALRRYVPIPPSKTHRDLMTAASVLLEPAREPFTRVVASAERATFGGWTPTRDDVEPLLASGEALLAKLAPEADDGAATGAAGSATGTS